MLFAISFWLAFASLMVYILSISPILQARRLYTRCKELKRTNTALADEYETVRQEIASLQLRFVEERAALQHASLEEKAALRQRSMEERAALQREAHDERAAARYRHQEDISALRHRFDAVQQFLEQERSDFRRHEDELRTKLATYETLVHRYLDTSSSLTLSGADAGRASSCKVPVERPPHLATPSTMSRPQKSMLSILSQASDTTASTAELASTGAARGKTVVASMDGAASTDDTATTASTDDGSSDGDNPFQQDRAFTHRVPTPPFLRHAAPAPSPRLRPLPEAQPPTSRQHMREGQERGAAHPAQAR